MLQRYGALRRYDRHVGDDEAGGRRLRRAGDQNPSLPARASARASKIPADRERYLRYLSKLRYSRSYVRAVAYDLLAMASSQPIITGYSLCMEW